MSEPYSAASVVAAYESRYNEVVASGSLSAMLGFLRNLLLLRMPAHASTDNSRTVQKIQQIGYYVDQLNYHIANQDMATFCLVFSQFLESGVNMRSCVIKRPGEDDVSVVKLRVMVFNVWSHIIRKVAVLVRAVQQKENIDGNLS